MKIWHTLLEGGLLKSWSHCDFWIVPLPYPPNGRSLFQLLFKEHDDGPTRLLSQNSRIFRVSDNLLPEQKLFPATPMEQWLEDLDTRVVGWETLTG